MSENQEKLPNCDQDIFKNGECISILASYPKEKVEAFCKETAKRTGAAVDWHYAAGRAVVKTTGDFVKVRGCFDKVVSEMAKAPIAVDIQADEAPPKRVYNPEECKDCVKDDSCCGGDKVRRADTLLDHGCLVFEAKSCRNCCSAEVEHDTGRHTCFWHGYVGKYVDASKRPQSCIDENHWQIDMYGELVQKEEEIRQLKQENAKLMRQRDDAREERDEVRRQDKEENGLNEEIRDNCGELYLRCNEMSHQISEKDKKIELLNQTVTLREEELQRYKNEIEGLEEKLRQIHSLSQEELF